MASLELSTRPYILKRMWWKHTKYSSMMSHKRSCSKDAWREPKQVADQMTTLKQSRPEFKITLINPFQLFTFTRSLVKSDILTQQDPSQKCMHNQRLLSYLNACSSLVQKHLENQQSVLPWPIELMENLLTSTNSYLRMDSKDKTMKVLSANSFRD